MKKYGFRRDRLRWVMLQKNICEETSTRVELLRVAWLYTISSLSPQSFKIFKITESKAICIRAGDRTLEVELITMLFRTTRGRPSDKTLRRSVEWNNWKHWCERCPWSDISIKFAGKYFPGSYFWTGSLYKCNPFIVSSPVSISHLLRFVDICVVESKSH